MKSKILISILFTLFLCGCLPSTRVAPRDVVGTFKGSYGGADETFVFRADGTFTQTLFITNHPPFTNDGQWQIKANRRQVELRNVYEALDLKGKLQQPPVKFNNMDGLWVSSDQWEGLVFDIDHSYLVEKVKSPGTTAAK